jgi:hypothetical protein
VQQLKAVLRQNTVLESLDLEASGSHRDYSSAIPQHINQGS